MRAKVAKNAGGHALEKRFLDLSEIELALLYRQAVKEEDEENKEKFEIIKTLNDVWSKKFNHHFDMLQLFTNAKMYKQKLEMKDIEKHREEINEDNFLEEWDKLMETIPEQVIYEEPDAMEALLVDNDPEFDNLVAGWINTEKKYSRE